MVRTAPTKGSLRSKCDTCADATGVASIIEGMNAMASSERKIIANVARLERYMDANGLYAVAVRTGDNFTY
jgi:hypothetical protein